jgi:hypothetical protein
VLILAGAQYVTLHIKIPKKKSINEENLTHAGLAHKNGFSPAYLLKLVKGAAKLCTS